MRIHCDDICAGFPWVRELWLLGPSEDTDILVVCERPPRAVPPGQRKRLLSELQARTDRRLNLRLTTPEQLSAWRAEKTRFAALFRQAVRLYPDPDE